jgi:hypothetical protein
MQRHTLQAMDWGVAAGVTGGVVGLAGLALGALGLRQANAANVTADSALQISRRAEKRNAKLAAIEMEHRDVRWQAEVRDNETVTFVHVGTTRALNVRLSVLPGEMPIREDTFGEIRPGGPVGMRLTAEVEEQRRLHQEELAAASGKVPERSPKLRVLATVIWESPAGRVDSETVALTVA